MTNSDKKHDTKKPNKKRQKNKIERKIIWISMAREVGVDYRVRNTTGGRTLPAALQAT